MATISRFEELEIWQDARKFCQWVATIESVLNERKLFRLKNQIKGSSGSVMDNIAEGFERSGRKEFIQYLIIAKGSAGEMRSQIYRLFDFEVISEQQMQTQIEAAIVLSKRIAGFIKYLKKSQYDGWKLKEPPPEYF